VSGAGRFPENRERDYPGLNQLICQYRQVLLTASWLATILTMDVTRHFARMVHDKRLQM
jgi:hypothetical protein